MSGFVIEELATYDGEKQKIPEPLLVATGICEIEIRIRSVACAKLRQNEQESAR